MLVMLHSGNRDRRLKRIARDADGHETGNRYEFAPGIPVEIDDKDLTTPALQKDLRNKVLVPVELDARRQPVVLEVEFDDAPKTAKKSAKKPKADTPTA
ncbi:MAG: hypothetical protein ACKV2Q_24855 [Planctomycetaceae bacterium]